MGWIPVTTTDCRNAETSGITTALELVLKMERQLVTVLATDPREMVHPREPMNKRLLLAKTILAWVPLAIETAPPAVRVLVLTACSLPVVEPNGVPATNRVVPLKTPAVAPETAMGVPIIGPFRFTFTTLAAVPPHSGPQFKTQTVLSLVSAGSKTAVYG